MSNRKRGHYEWQILATMYLGYASLMLCRNTLISTSAAVVADPELGVDLAGYGVLMSWHSVGAIAGKLVLGVLADRIGGRRMFLICLAMTAVATVAFGGVTAFYVLAFLNFLGQFFKSGAWPAVAKIIGDWYAPATHGRVWSLISTSSRVGTISAGLIVGALLMTLSWRGAFVFSGAIAALVFVMAWFLLREKPSDVGLPPPPSTTLKATDPNHPLAELTLGAALIVFAKSRRVWLICLAMAFLTVLMDFLNFIPIYLSETTSVDVAQAGMAGSSFPMGMFAALVVCSVFYSRLSPRQLIFWLGAALGLACLCAALLWLLPSLPVPAEAQLPVAIGVLFTLGFAVSPAYYLPMSVFSIAFGGRHSGFLIALIDVVGYMGALVFNLFGGSVAQNFGWPVFLAVVIGIALAALATMTTFLTLDARAQLATTAPG